jgi:GAF domain-containing protein
MMPLDPARLHELFDILKDIHSIHQPNRLWRYILERSCQLLGAEGGSFFTVLPDDRMELAAAVGVDEERLRRVPMRVGTGVCGWVAQNRQPALVDNAHSDSRFNPFADQVTGVSTQSLLCIPVFSMEKTYGVLELVNGANGTFTADDQEFMSVLGQQTAVAYQNLLLIKETAQTKVLFESVVINMGGGLIAMDAQGAVTILNPSARQLLALPSMAVVGAPAAAVLMEYPALLQVLMRTLASKTMVSREETTLTVSGQPSRFGYSTIYMSDTEQTMVGSGVIFQKLSPA